MGMTKELTVSERIALNVKAEAVRCGVTNDELEKALGKGKTALHARLNGSVEFRPSELALLAELMGIDMKVFVHGVGGKVAI